MPSIDVQGARVWYEVYGKGPTVFYLQAAYGGRNPGAYFIAGRLSKHYRVIIWDSPNAGRQSDSVIADRPSEEHLCCDAIYGLCRALGETAIHVAGCSGGGEIALLFAHLHPEMVKSVAMYRPTDMSTGPEQEFTRARFHALAEVAERGDMRRVIEYSANPPAGRWGHVSGWIASIANKADEREKLLAMDPHRFAAILRQWGDWQGQKGFYRANLDDESLRAIQAPVLLAPAADPFHPEEQALELREKLPRSHYIPSPFFREEKDMYGMPGEEHHFGGLVDFAAHYAEFLGGCTGD